MELKQVYSLPRDEAGYGNIRITADSVNLSVEFEYWEGGQRKVGLISVLTSRPSGSSMKCKAILRVTCPTPYMRSLIHRGANSFV